MTPANLWRDLDRARLVRLCAAVSGDRHAAEDLAQETLLEAWRIRRKLREPAGFEPWLSAIARNVCRRWARRLGRELPATSLGAETFAEPRDVLDLEAELERTEMAELVDRALGALPAVSREAMRQRYVDDRSVTEIAHRTGSTPDAVSMRLARGRAHLRRSLAGDLRQEAESLGLSCARLTPGRTPACTAPSAAWARSSCGSSQRPARSPFGARAATRTRPLGRSSSGSPIRPSPACWQGWCARPPSCGGPMSGHTPTTARGWRPAASPARSAAPACAFRPTTATTFPPAATAVGSTPIAPTAGSRSRRR